MAWKIPNTPQRVLLFLMIPLSYGVGFTRGILDGNPWAFGLIVGAFAALAGNFLFTKQKEETA